jgi:hypothetical protein
MSDYSKTAGRELMSQQPSISDDQQRLEDIISRMQKIQRAIKASRQPASMYELTELKQLGNEYARIVERLANRLDDTGLA